MNDYIIFGVAYVLGILTPFLCEWLTHIKGSRDSNKSIKRSLMRMDAELNGIKALLKDEKNPETQLLNEQLEREFGDTTPTP